MYQYSLIFVSAICFFFSCTNQLSQPCQSSCSACSSQTQCTSCTQQYYPAIINSVLSCSSCSQYCLTCSSLTLCTGCQPPYVLQSNGTCKECQIAHAATCTSIISAKTCISGYYLSDNYCYTCLLNCATCTSNTDCTNCTSGFYLNSSVLTCNPCPSNCLTCNPNAPNQCYTCSSNYMLSSNSCLSVSCTILNCLSCSTSTTCQLCNQGFYKLGNTCVKGSGLLCSGGAIAAGPKGCVACGLYSYAAGSGDGTAVWCLPYKNIDVDGVKYEQMYLYSYNDVNKMNSYFSLSQTLALETSGEYSYPVPQNSTMTIQLSSYYKVTLLIKYESSYPINLTLSATTESTKQTQYSYLATTTQTNIKQIQSLFVHSNNFSIKFNSTLNIIELLVRVWKCPSWCQRCVNWDLCQMCKAPQFVSSYTCVDNCSTYYHLVQNRTCLASCPSQYYPTNLGTNSKFCEPCVSPCKTCISQSKCLSCQGNTFLHSYSCLSTCPQTYFAVNSLSLCMPCISPCKTCTNQTKCLSCTTGFWDATNTKCVSQCPAGYYGNTSLLSCQSCQSPCLYCSSSPSKCTSCSPSTYLHNSQCLSSCPARYYPLLLNYTCQICKPPCLTCTSSTQCASCSYNYLYEQSCISTCPTYYYPNIATKICQSCSTQCLTCSTFGKCTTCKTGCYLEGQCPTVCPIGYYQGGTSGCVCETCVYPCKLCSSASICISCAQGYLYSSNNSCLTACPSSYFPDSSTFICQLCSNTYSSSCLQCTSSECTQCSASTFLFNKTCISICPSGYYASGFKCQKCVVPCNSCISFGECSTCVDTYIWNDGGCVVQCPFGKIEGTIDIINGRTCIKCELPCLGCQGGLSTNCTICTYGYFLHNNTCILNCSSVSPINTLYNEPATSSCSKCLYPCKTCSSPSYCLSCQIGYLTPSNKCENCPVSTYPSDTAVCLSCPSQCFSCYNNQLCIACMQGYYLYGYECISDSTICLQNGYYPVGRICKICSSPCQKCLGSATACTTCVSGYIYYLGTCILECPSGTYRNSNTCSLCDSMCQTCSGSSTFCFSCKSPYMLILSSMHCSTSCPNTTFVLGTSCQVCQYPCLQCQSQSQCLSCLSGTLSQGNCLSSCPSGQYSGATGSCQNCKSPCKQCEGNEDSCRQCIDGYFLTGDKCLAQCPPQYFGQSVSGQCLQCLGMCEQCSSHINCTSCASTLIFYYNQAKDYGQCLTQCPAEFYQDTLTPTCKQCQQQCLTCSDNSSCLLCKSNKAQHEGLCFAQCPSQMYALNGVCQTCSSPCFNCTGAYTCTACINSQYLLVGGAECIIGEICPQGYYRLIGTQFCNSQCPAEFFYRLDRVCGVNCDIDQYKNGQYCVQQCPNGYIANQTFDCVECFSDQCLNGLFFTIGQEIKRDQIYLYLIFTDVPVYLSNEVAISLQPHFENKIHLDLAVEKIQRNERLMLQYVAPIRNITIELYPDNSFEQMTLKLTFINAFATYSNPIQRTSQTIVLNGYDLYPDLPYLYLGIIFLICSLVGLVKNPLMTDFAQLIYLFAFLNIHYPVNLSSLLESSRLAHLHGLVSISQQYANGSAKFSYVSNLGLLSNCFINMIILLIGLVIFFILFIAYQILKKFVNYNRVDQDPNDNNQNTNKNQQNHNEESVADQQKVSLKVFKFLQKNFIDNFRMDWLNRLVYFNYLPISVFTFGQLSTLYFSNDSPNDLASSALSLVVIIGLVLYPIYVFVSKKQKYTFLILRKLILSVVIVFSIENPTYMIGVTAVVALISCILVGAYAVEKWKTQTKFNSTMEVVQAFILICFAVFAIVGDGVSTKARLIISWVIIVMIVGTAFAYLFFAILSFTLWVCRTYRGIDYIQMWKVADGEHGESDKNSQMSDNALAKAKDNQKDDKKIITVSKLLSTLKEPSKEFSLPIQNHQNSRVKRQSATPLSNNNLFWTYNQNEEGEDNDKQEKAPEMLIRCVNEFSDYDKSSKKEENEDEK